MPCAFNRQLEMLAKQQQFTLRAAAEAGETPLALEPLQLIVTLKPEAAGFEFEWLRAASSERDGESA